ncbi:MAG: hypothetical protein ABI591_15320 [Kofleriaceae bacterium]
MNRLITFACVLALAACSSPAKQPMTLEQMIAADPLPLAKGAKWTYDVTIKRYDVDSDKESVKTLTWTTEVLDAHESNGVIAYRVKGWLSDLMTGPDAVAPVATERTLLRSGNHFLFGASPEPTLDGADGWFSWPVIDGEKICPKTETVYCWQVAAVDNGYSLSFITGPDEQVYDIEPGTGVSRFHYAHHGPTDEVEAKLASYTKGSRQ